MSALNGRPAGTTLAVRTAAADKFVVTTERLDYMTEAGPCFLDITDDVMRAVRSSGVQAGQVTVFSRHTTAAIRINEHEPLLLHDMTRMLRAAAPENAYYEHNDFERRTVNMNPDECRNGHSHCQHLFLGNSESIPVVDGLPALGAYQRIFLVELDHPRPRCVLVTTIGLR